jgi:hypothetical protein
MGFSPQPAIAMTAAAQAAVRMARMVTFHPGSGVRKRPGLVQEGLAVKKAPGARGAASSSGMPGG